MTGAEEMTVRGRRYVVVKARTAQDMQEMGFPGLAALMEEQGVGYCLTVRRYRGRNATALYANRLPDGRYIACPLHPREIAR